MKPEFMGSRELKVLFQLIEKHYGGIPKIFDELAFVQNKEKIYLITRDIDRIDFAKMRINSLGLYIAEVKGEQVRLSIEGAQLIGPVATKNVCEISLDQLKDWLQGKDVLVSGTFDGFVILKCGKDFVGSGKFKEGSIVNYIPKARRLNEVH